MGAISIHAVQINGKYEPYSSIALINLIKAEFFPTSDIPVFRHTYSIRLCINIPTFSVDYNSLWHSQLPALWWLQMWLTVKWRSTQLSGLLTVSGKKKKKSNYCSRIHICHRGNLVLLMFPLTNPVCVWQLSIATVGGTDGFLHILIFLDI